MDLKNHCVICGIKSKELDNRMCLVCKHLADEKFYTLENEFKVRSYFKDYLGKVPDVKEREDIKKLFKEKPTNEWIHGIMPSKCPFCQNLSTNRGIIQSIKIGSPQYKKVINKGETPSLVCKACGDLSLYLVHVYNFSKYQSLDILNHIKKFRIDIKEKKLVICKECAESLGKKEDYDKKNESRTDEEKELMKKHAKKLICDKCLNKLGEDIVPKLPENCKSASKTD